MKSLPTTHIYLLGKQIWLTLHKSEVIQGLDIIQLLRLFLKAFFIKNILYLDRQNAELFFGWHIAELLFCSLNGKLTNF